MKFGNAKTKVPPASGKGGRQHMLPSRHALAELTKGDPHQRSMGNYAKLTPSGAGALPTYQSIYDMGKAGLDVEPTV